MILLTRLGVSVLNERIQIGAIRSFFIFLANQLEKYSFHHLERLLRWIESERRRREDDALVSIPEVVEDRLFAKSERVVVFERESLLVESHDLGADAVSTRLGPHGLAVLGRFSWQRTPRLERKELTFSPFPKKTTR